MEYDDVMNQQREVLYGQRRLILNNQSLRETILHMVDSLIINSMNQYADEKLYPEEWNYEGLLKHLEIYFLEPGMLTVEQMEEYGRAELQEHLIDIAHKEYEKRESLFGEANMRELEKAIMLKVVDSKWMEHLDAIDMLKEGIGLRAYGQKNPLVEYKFEAYDMFESMKEAITDETIMYLYRIQINVETIAEEEPVDHLVDAKTHHEDVLEPQNVD